MSDYPEKGAARPYPDAFGRSLTPGIGVNLLVKDVDRAARFQAEVFGAEVVYWEDHFAIMRFAGTIWMLHSDWSYRDNPFRGSVEGVEARGAGAEIRLYGADPDACVDRARARDAIVLAASEDKPHGLREAFIVDDDGYVWSPSIALPE